MERVFLSRKMVVLTGIPTGTTQDDIAKNLLELLVRPITVKDKYETVVDRGIARSIVSRGVLRLENGKLGYLFGICYLGTPVNGMYFFQEGDNYLTEMVDPDRKRVVRVVSGVSVNRS